MYRVVPQTKRGYNSIWFGEYKKNRCKWV